MVIVCLWQLQQYVYNVSTARLHHVNAYGSQYVYCTFMLGSRLQYIYSTFLGRVIVRLRQSLSTLIIHLYVKRIYGRFAAHSQHYAKHIYGTFTVCLQYVYVRIWQGRSEFRVYSYILILHLRYIRSTFIVCLQYVHHALYGIFVMSSSMVVLCLWLSHDYSVFLGNLYHAVYDAAECVDGCVEDGR